MLYAYSHLLYAHLKYGGSCSIYIAKAICTYMIKIEQLPPYFEYT
jgi:hypothetical protein